MKNMGKINLISYNFIEQRFDIEVTHPVVRGAIVIKDIDLSCTVWKMDIWDLNGPMSFFMSPCPKETFDFDRDDFGGFKIELWDEGEVLETKFIRFRTTGLESLAVDYKDHHHPSFMNYREFFIDDLYNEFNLENCNTVIDAGASIGLFTKYMLRKGAKQVLSIEPDSRSVAAFEDNYFSNPKVTLIKKALASTSGTKKFYEWDGNPLISSLDETWVGNDKYEEVDSTTLEQVLDRHSILHLDLLKLDIESGEYEVIESTPDYIFDRIDRILLEYHMPFWNTNLPEGRLVPLINKLTRLGYKYQLAEGNNLEDKNGVMLFYR